MRSIDSRTGPRATREPGLELGRAGLGEDQAGGVEQVELDVGLVQHQAAQPALELLRALLVHVEDVVVHADDAAEERHAAPVGGLVLEALERVDDGGDDQERRHQARWRRSSARA